MDKEAKDCDYCQYQVDYIDEDKWYDKCPSCGADMSQFTGFLSWSDYKLSLAVDKALESDTFALRMKLNKIQEEKR